MKNISKKTSLMMLAVVLGISAGVSTTYAAHLDVDLSESEAKVIAEELYKGSGSLTDIELETEDGVRVYAVEFTESDGNEVDVKIVANTGKLVVIEDDKTDTEEDDDVSGKDDEDEEDDQVLLAPHAKLSESEAKVLALKAYAGTGTLTETGLEDEDGVVVYEFEFTETDGTEVDIKIDAATGAVVASVDDEDEDGEEADDEKDGNAKEMSTSVTSLQVKLMSLLQQLIALLKQ